MDNVRKETHVVSVMTNKLKETCAVVRDEKDDRLLPHQIRRPETDEVREKSSNKFLATMRTSLQIKGENFHADVKF